MPFKKGFKKKSQPKVPKAIKKYVHKAIDEEAEHKCIDVSISHDSISASGHIYFLTPISQGDTSFNRTGAKVKPLTFKMNWSVYNGSNGDVDTNRIIIFSYKAYSYDQITSVVVSPTPPDILADNNSSGGFDQFSHYNMVNSENYHIIYDSMFNVLGSTGNGNAAVAHCNKVIKKLRTGHIQYVQSGGGPQALGANNIFMLVLDGTGNTFINFTSRVTYTDV